MLQRNWGKSFGVQVNWRREKRGVHAKRGACKVISAMDSTPSDMVLLREAMWEPGIYLAHIG